MGCCAPTQNHKIDERSRPYRMPKQEAPPASEPREEVKAPV